MEQQKVEIVLEGVLKVRVNGELVAVVDNKNRSQILYTATEMGAEEIKGLLELIAKSK